jgi:hypothetical protein
MPTPANLRPSPLRAPRWHKTLVVAVLLAAAACADVADTPSTPRSTQPPPTPTGTGVTVPAFDRGRFTAVIPLPDAGCVTVADGVLWVLDASGTVVRIDPATNTAVGEPLRVPARAASAEGEIAFNPSGVASGTSGRQERGRAGQSIARSVPLSAAAPFP